MENLPVLLECDVLVCGGGPAGIAGAAAAAKAGAKTVIIERYSSLGGNITIVGVGTPSWYRQENTTTAGGIAKEIEERMFALDAATPLVPGRKNGGYVYNTEIYKVMIDDLMDELGVQTVYDCIATAPAMQDGAVIGVVTESKSGRMLIKAKRVVDATGDADIAARAGAPYEIGDPKTGKLFFGSLRFVVTGVDTRKLRVTLDKDCENNPFAHFSDLHSPMIRAHKAGAWPIETGRMGTFCTIMNDTDVEFNTGSSDNELDSTDVLSLSNSEKKLRRGALKFIDMLNEYGKEDGFGQAKLLHFRSCVGARESRRIKSTYMITYDEIMHGARFDDTVGVFPRYADGIDKLVIPYTSDYFQVPFRAVTPQNVRNLLVAGRCCACDQDAVATTRQMDYCMITGQAAGAASALSIQKGCDSEDIDIAALQAELERQGVRVH